MKIKSLNNKYIGYRSEGLYGEGYRDLRAVVEHEVEELGNEDILETQGFSSMSEMAEFIDRLYDLGYTECVWLVDSIQDFYDEYVDHPGLVSSDEYLFDKYIISNPIVINDLGGEGKLVAYRPRDLEVFEDINED